MESFQGRTVKLWGCTVTAIFEIDVFDIYKLRDVFQENFLDFWRKGYKKHDEIWLLEIFRAKTQKARKHPLNLITLERTRLTLISDIQVSFRHNRVRDFVKNRVPFYNTTSPREVRWRDAPVTTGRSRLCWHLHRDLGISTFTTSPPAKSPSGWSVTTRHPHSVAAKAPALCKPLPSPKSTFFFSEGGNEAKADRPTGRPASAQLGRFFGVLFFYPFKKWKEQRTKTSKSGKAAIEKWPEISPWEFQPPEVWRFRKI